MERGRIAKRQLGHDLRIRSGSGETSRFARLDAIRRMAISTVEVRATLGGIYLARSAICLLVPVSSPVTVRVALPRLRMA
jgi:hypothetical protein